MFSSSSLTASSGEPLRPSDRPRAPGSPRPVDPLAVPPSEARGDAGGLLGAGAGGGRRRAAGCGRLGAAGNRARRRRGGRRTPLLGGRHEVRRGAGLGPGVCLRFRPRVGFGRARWCRPLVARARASRATVRSRVGHRDTLDRNVDADLVDQRLPDQLGVVAGPERVGQSHRGDAEHEPMAVVVDDLGVLRQERPRHPAHREDPRQHVRPDATQRRGVEATALGGRSPPRAAPMEATLRPTWSAAPSVEPGRRRARRGRDRGSGPATLRLDASESGGADALVSRGPAAEVGAALRGGGAVDRAVDGGGGRETTRWTPQRDAVASRSRRGRLGRAGLRRPRRGGDSAEVEATFEPVETSRIPARAGRGRQQDASADQLELHARSRGAGHLGEAGVDDVGRAGQGTRAEPGLLAAHPFQLVLGYAPEHRRRTLRHGGDDDEVAQPFEQVLDEPPRVMARLDDLVDLGEHRRAVAGGERVDGGVEQLAVGEPEQRRRTLVGEALVAGSRDELVEHRERVADRPAAGPGHEPEDARSDRDALLPAEVLHVRRQAGGRDQPERVVVGPRPDRPDDLLGLGRGEDELHVLRRLLDDLQQGVEALRRHHVRLVDDVDLVAALRRPVGGAFAQVTGVVDTAMGGRVDLDDVDRAGPAASERHTRVAYPARVRRRALLAVETAGQDARAGRLAAAARAAEEVGVAHPTGAQRLHEGLGDVLLADDVAERLRPVAAVQRGGHPRTLVAPEDTGQAP